MIDFIAFNLLIDNSLNSRFDRSLYFDVQHFSSIFVTNKRGCCLLWREMCFML